MQKEGQNRLVDSQDFKIGVGVLATYQRENLKKAFAYYPPIEGVGS